MSPLGFLDTRSVPPLARRNYWVELQHTAVWGLFTGVVEGNTSSIVVAKTFHGSGLLIAFVWATPMVANMLSLVWSVLARGRRKLPMFMLLAVGSIAAMCSIALTPTDWHPFSGWVFAGQVALARIFLSGLITVRTTLWSANYPLARRAQIAGQLQSLRFLNGLFASAAVGLVFDANADHYRWVYPLVGAIGLISLWPMRRMRVRGEAAEIARQRARHADQPEPTLLGGLREAAAILKTDPAYARYCAAMYFLGSSNFMVDPILAIVVAKELGLGYLTSSILLDHLPNVIMLLSIPAWARLFDQSGVVRFRVLNSMVWVLSAALAMLAMLARWTDLTHAYAITLGILVLARIVNGVGRGGGSIAWNLGHLHFSKPGQEELYLGIHVTLTGLRGMIMPFIGIAAYSLLGWGAFAIAIVLGAVSVELFRRLAQTDPQPLATSMSPDAAPRPVPELSSADD